MSDIYEFRDMHRDSIHSLLKDYRDPTPALTDGWSGRWLEKTCEDRRLFEVTEPDGGTFTLYEGPSIPNED